MWIHVCTVEDADHAVLDYMKNMTQEKKVQHASSLKKHKCYDYLKSFLFISVVELDHWRSAAETLLNKMGLNRK